MTKNCSSPNARWTLGHGMTEHDRLPAPLRAFMIQSELPWSAGSVLTIWRKARARGDSPEAALARVKRAAAATLAREARNVWGPDHPAAKSP